MPLERRPGDPDQIRQRADINEQVVDENRNAGENSMGSVQLPAPVIPNLSRVGGQSDENSPRSESEIEIIEVQDHEVMAQ